MSQPATDMPSKITRLPPSLKHRSSRGKPLGKTVSTPDGFTVIPPKVLQALRFMVDNGMDWKDAGAACNLSSSLMASYLDKHHVRKELKRLTQVLLDNEAIKTIHALVGIRNADGSTDRAKIDAGKTLIKMANGDGAKTVNNYINGNQYVSPGFVLDLTAFPAIPTELTQLPASGPKVIEHQANDTRMVDGKAPSMPAKPTQEGQ